MQAPEGLQLDCSVGIFRDVITTEESAYKYWAFIAYTPDGETMSAWLHSSLETFGIPKLFVGKPIPNGTIPKRLLPVFRDKDELPLATGSDDQIYFALRQSRHLIVVCTPQSAVCPNIEKQIRYFKSLGRNNQITCLTVGPNQAGDSKSTKVLVPKSAQGAMVFDSKNIRKAKLAIIARILGLGLDDLVQRDLQRMMRRQQVILIGTGVLFVVFSLMAVTIFIEKGGVKIFL